MSLIAILAWLLGQGFVVSQVVDLLKRLPFIQAHAKLVAGILNVLVMIVATYLVGPVGEAFSSFLLAVIAGLTAASVSVASYEIKKAAFVR